MPQQLMTTQQLNRFYEDNPNTTMAAAAAHFGVSVATVNQRLAVGAGGRVLRLSDLDVKVFQFIIDHTVKHGWSPTVSEVVGAVGCSRAAAHTAIHRLNAYGCIAMGEGARTIRVVGSSVSMKGVKRDPR